MIRRPISDSGSHFHYYLAEESFTEKKIRAFLGLQLGWHFGEGQPPTRERVDSALKIAREAHFAGFETDTFPGVWGEIRIALYWQDFYADFTIEPDDRITVSVEEDGEETEYEEGLSFEDALTKLIQLRTRICGTPESLVPNTGIQGSADFKAWPSGIHQGEAFPSSPMPASSQPRARSVDTYTGSTSRFRAHPQYSGVSNGPYWQIDVHSSNIRALPEMSATAT